MKTNASSAASSNHSAEDELHEASKHSDTDACPISPTNDGKAARAPMEPPTCIEPPRESHTTDEISAQTSSHDVTNDALVLYDDKPPAADCVSHV
mmetsp:Transcript_17361/g.41560  ORF Transcript_17361/g.41560 Transcript_17361/m.41560 type:complete len:95 (-) Transcript_17361:245-529(-)